MLEPLIINKATKNILTHLDTLILPVRIKRLRRLGASKHVAQILKRIAKSIRYNPSSVLYLISEKNILSLATQLQPGVYMPIFVQIASEVEYKLDMGILTGSLNLAVK